MNETNLLILRQVALKGAVELHKKKVHNLDQVLSDAERMYAWLQAESVEQKPLKIN